VGGRCWKGDLLRAKKVSLSGQKKRTKVSMAEKAKEKGRRKKCKRAKGFLWKPWRDFPSEKKKVVGGGADQLGEGNSRGGGGGGV